MILKQRLFIPLILLGVVGLLSACSNFQTVLEGPGRPVQFEEIRHWSPARAEAELSGLEQHYADFPTPENRLRLALALGFGQCKSCDAKRAAELLQMQVNLEDSTVSALSAVYLELLETRAQLAAFATQVKSQETQIKQLEKKLEALTSIEESLHQRE